MSRKLISILDDVIDSVESISKLKSWESEESPHVPKPSGKIESNAAKTSGKIASMISQFEDKSSNSEKFEIFATEKVSKDPKFSKVSQIHTIESFSFSY